MTEWPIETEEGRKMKNALLSMVILVASNGMLAAADQPAETFHAYVDSDVCARLMLGPINESRVNCSLSTVKDGADPVLIRLQNNMVLEVNKEKMIRKLVSQFLLATGEVKAKNGTMKLAEVSPEQAKDIPSGDPARRLMDVRNYRTKSTEKVYEKIRHELAMMPYISEFDFISFSMVGSDVILTGWTVRQTNRSEAYNRVKSIEGVTSIVNNIDVLPLGSTDMQIRSGARGQLQQSLGRYFWGSGSDIKIIVKNGDIILLGSVASKSDSDLAAIRCNQVRGAFHVFNLLRIAEPAKKATT
jgi:osmotically-inducible protein OsmY